MALHSNKTILSYSANGSSYTPVTLVKKISGPSIEWSDVDDSHLNMSDKFRIFSQGLGDGGEIEFELHFAKGMVNTLYATIANATNPTYFWKVEFPLITGETTASNWVMTGHINQLGSEFELDENIMQSIKIKVASKPVFTQGS